MMDTFPEYQALWKCIDEYAAVLTGSENDVDARLAAVAAVTDAISALVRSTLRYSYRRERIATACLQGLLASDTFQGNHVELALGHADDLIAELDKDQ